jgi:uncharacterized protein (TIGR00251 family)
MHDDAPDVGTPGSPLGCGARWDGGDLVLAVRVIPRASADAVLPEADCLKVRVLAPPVDGKANRRLTEILSKQFGVPRRRVTVERGETSRIKRVRIQAPAKVPAFLRGC